MIMRLVHLRSAGGGGGGNSNQSPTVMHRHLLGGALSHFTKASKPKPANTVFLPPSVPIGYQPFVDVKETYNLKQEKTSLVHLSSEARGKLLGEQPLQKKTKSVFDFLSKDDKDRIASTKRTLQTNPPIVKNHFTQQCSYVRAIGFQPFPKDPAKQARYDSFLNSRKSGAESSNSDELGLVNYLFLIHLFTINFTLNCTNHMQFSDGTKYIKSDYNCVILHNIFNLTQKLRTKINTMKTEKKTLFDRNSRNNGTEML